MFGLVRVKSGHSTHICWFCLDTTRYLTVVMFPHGNGDLVLFLNVLIKEDTFKDFITMLTDL